MEEVIHQQELVVVELVVGAGDHWDGAGGYSGGMGELGSGGRQEINGGETVKPEMDALSGNGGSYFFSHRYDGRNAECLAGMIGGQGGECNSANWWCDSGGDGGVAGKGGTVKVSASVKVYAYNGNRYTDKMVGHEYVNSTAATHQCPIFAQEGVLREVYKLNAWWGTKNNYNYQYFSNLLGNTIASGLNTIAIANNKSEINNIKIREEITESASLKIKNGYQNPALINKSLSERSVSITVNDETKIIDMLTQGVGSGAGYIEISNGTYEVDNNMK